MILNGTFYPTPKTIIKKMISKIKRCPSYILEPSAGKGDIVDVLCGVTEKHGNRFCNGYDQGKVSTIEIDETLQATLRGKGYKVIDADFLAFSGSDQFDLIIANPPFDHGDLHLLKAIDIMYDGEIIFLLNAETIRNPYTNTRKELTTRLAKLNAEIEYLGDVFTDAERRTDVEVVLVYINIHKEIEEDLFEKIVDTNEEIIGAINDDHNKEVSTGRTIEEMVLEYQQTVKYCSETLLSYYKNYKKIWKYIGMNREPDKYYSGSDKRLTDIMRSEMNEMLSRVRHDYWHKVLDIKEVNKRMTQKKRKEFEVIINHRCHMDFTETNIRQFVMNLMTNYEKMLTEAVLGVFDFMTSYGWDNSKPYLENIHYYNGWKTNDSFKVGKKIILPMYGLVDNYSKNRKWQMPYSGLEPFWDIDIVMNYFAGLNGYVSITDAIKGGIDIGQTSGLESTFFMITIYKKGTIHLSFRDDEVLRKFNLTACKGKNWLPDDYGDKPYSDYAQETRQVIDAFEGKDIYSRHAGQKVFAEQMNFMIGA